MTGDESMRRRGFLQFAGAATVVVAAGAVWRAHDRGVFASGEGPAYEPWKHWRTDQPAGPLALVRAAILAANPHNTQPWLFRVSPSRIDVFANTRRNIGAIDPYLREMHTGVGCALENLMLAAAANGFAAQVALAPNPANTSHAARIELAPAPVQESDLYRAIPHRHTNRGPYRPDAVVTPATQLALQALAGADPELKVFWFSSAAERARVGGPAAARGCENAAAALEGTK
jgi:nitroreductase